MAPIAIRYSLRRGELWRWYLHTWRRRLWRAHVGFIALAFAIALLPGGAALDVRLTTAAAVSVIGLAFMFGYPQLMFKPEERWLQISEAGLETSIRGMSRNYAWGDVTDIAERDGDVQFTIKNKNAFLVPGRAFSVAAERDAFVNQARNWRRG